LIHRQVAHSVVVTHTLGRRSLDIPKPIIVGRSTTYACLEEAEQRIDSGHTQVVWILSDLKTLLETGKAIAE
jgi:hypothetical protein